MANTIILMVIALGAGFLINFFLDHKLSVLMLKFALGGVLVGLLGGILGKMTPGESCLAVLIVVCTGLIIEEVRKKN